MSKEESLAISVALPLKKVIFSLLRSPDASLISCSLYNLVITPFDYFSVTTRTDLKYGGELLLDLSCLSCISNASKSGYFQDLEGWSNYEDLSVGQTRKICLQVTCNVD